MAIQCDHSIIFLGGSAFLRAPLNRLLTQTHQQKHHQIRKLMDPRIGKLLITILTVLAAVKAVKAETEEDHIPWYGLGQNQCHGRETCSVGEYCSNNQVWEGCRNCTVIQPWCTLDMDHVRKKYPSCEAFCERELKRLDDEKHGSEINRLTEQNEQLLKSAISLNDTLMTTERNRLVLERELNSTRTALAEFHKFGNVTRADGQQTEDWTTALENMKHDITKWKLACISCITIMTMILITGGGVICSFWRDMRRLRKPAAQGQDAEVPNEENIPMLRTPIPVQGQSTEDTDSGHGAGTSCSATPNSSNPSLIAPNGYRVAFVPQDAGDFMQNSSNV